MGDCLMRTTITILLTGLFILSLAGAAGAMDERQHKSQKSVQCKFNRTIDFDDDGTLCLEYKDRRHERIEITADYKLYINGRRIKTDDEADELIEKYYEQTAQLITEAEKIGIKAAKIGLHGGELGINAVSGVLRAFLTDYEFEALERDLEDEAEKLEALAEGLEEEAEEIEEMAEELDDLAYELSREVPELRKMKWFYD
jgi:cell division protein ZapA (FtsZ GTPase activity inhibitor)